MSSRKEVREGKSQGRWGTGMKSGASRQNREQFWVVLLKGKGSGGGNVSPESGRPGDKGL